MRGNLLTCEHIVSVVFPRGEATYDEVVKEQELQTAEGDRYLAKVVRKGEDLIFNFRDLDAAEDPECFGVPLEDCRGTDAAVLDVYELFVASCYV